MAKRKAKQAEEVQEQTAPVEVEAPKVEAEVVISKTETTTQTYTQMVDKLVCSLNELAKGNYNRDALVKQAKSLLLQYESPAMESTIQYCFIELDAQQPAELKWGVIINAIRDAVTQANK